MAAGGEMMTRVVGPEAYEQKLLKQSCNLLEILSRAVRALFVQKNQKVDTYQKVLYTTNLFLGQFTFKRAICDVGFLRQGGFL